MQKKIKVLQRTEKVVRKYQGNSFNLEGKCLERTGKVLGKYQERTGQLLGMQQAKTGKGPERTKKRESTVKISIGNVPEKIWEREITWNVLGK